MERARDPQSKGDAMTTLTIDPATTVDMTTLDCPYGCGEKLVVNEDGEANCPTDGGPFGWADECEGCTAYFPHADAVVDAASDVYRFEKQQLRFWQAELGKYQELVSEAEKAVRQADKRWSRIARQHG